MKYCYPAVFAHEENGYSVIFPDLPGCATCGDDLPDALDMAREVLELVLYGMEDDGEAIPAPSDLADVPREEGEFASYVFADTFQYRKELKEPSVKVTVSIPRDLTEAAEEAGFDFSDVMTAALRDKLNPGH